MILINFAYLNFPIHGTFKFGYKSEAVVFDVCVGIVVLRVHDLDTPQASVRLDD